MSRKITAKCFKGYYKAFEAQEKLRKKREKEGRVHSCEASGCEFDPQGDPIA